ncbi:DEAD/DEAH box helicase family protein [Candidatus Uhrbacteria bacterium]|nr:DEAD/DEAH box helicase family protein [Candidatus Uhrbacteria bacterium]
MVVISEQQLELYMSLFHGRTDVYARRWEKEGRSGYSPAYDFIWDEFMAHKRRGGSMKDFEYKKLIALTNDVVKKHPLGGHVIGMYPILSDNTSYFIVADFDGENWLADSKAFSVACAEVGLSAYLERSRSGNGGHVWMFFSEAYPCYKSRQIALELIRRAFHVSEFEKEVSFDRLFPNQDTLTGAGFGNLIVAPSGSGKTVIGLELIARRQLPALILVHRKQLLDQWVERIQTFLGIAKAHIGQYSGTKKKLGKQITVGLLQSLARKGNLTELRDTFGTIIVDECHHIPAATFREVIAELNPKYLYGLTATPKRKHNDEKLIYVYIGDIVARMEASDIAPVSELSRQPPEVLIHTTTLALPFKFTTDNFQLLAKVVCFDTARNQMIIEDILSNVSDGKRLLVLSERKEHLEILALYLKGKCETIVISGDDSARSRTSKLKQIESGHYRVILSTGQFFGEGIDIRGISCLILAFPFAFEGKLVQYIGRLRDIGSQKTIIDYRDAQIPFLERQFKQRQRYYKKLSVNFVSS